MAVSNCVRKSYCTFILAHSLTNNIYLSVFKNINFSVFYFSVFIYPFMYLFS